MVVLAMSFYVYSTSLYSKEKAKDPETHTSNSVEREIHKHAIGVGLGQTFLLGQFKNHGINQTTADILYTYTASYSFDLLVNVHFSDHEFEGKKVKLAGYNMSIKGRSYEFDAFSPFLLGGLGFYTPQITEKDGTRSDIKNTFGFNLGGGADLRLNEKVIIGLMAQFHKPFEIKQEETDNVTGSYLKLLLTAMYLF